MKKNKKECISHCFRMMCFSFLLLLYVSAQADNHSNADTIKVAVLDDFNETPNVPLAFKYKIVYLQGIETAEYTAKQKNINIKSKFFLYGVDMLDILHAVPVLNAWKADLVLGPNSSDQFLLLKNSLPNVLVLSSYASDINLKNMPKNFYSTFLPDDKIMALLSQYISKKFPEKNIYLIEQIDCKQCMDVSQLFVENYKKINSHAKVVQNKIILDENIETIDSKKLIKGHESDVILIFNNTYYEYNLLVHHISTAFPGKHLVFFSDQDNWNNEVDGRTHPFDLPYESYRIGPLLFDSNLLEFKRFTEAYEELYHKKPQAAMSYMTYVALTSVLEALQQYPCSNAQSNNMRERILCSYEKALKSNPNWFRNRAMGIYQLTSKGEVLVEQFPTAEMFQAPH